MNEAPETALRKLRLSGLASTLEVRLQDAASNRLNCAEFLELVLQDELSIRKERRIARRTKAAAFRDQKTLDDFDWRFNTSVKKKDMYELATCKFVREARDILLIGPPGTGKTHLCVALGLQAIHLEREPVAGTEDLLRPPPSNVPSDPAEPAMASPFPRRERVDVGRAVFSFSCLMV